LDLSVPDQVGLSTFDDSFWTRLVTPAVTVIDQPAYEMGQTATELLLKRINEPERPTREIILKGNLIIRQSSAKASRL
jgi:LacI family fructose operon transcriptional repressor